MDCPSGGCEQQSVAPTFSHPSSSRNKVAQLPLALTQCAKKSILGELSAVAGERGNVHPPRSSSSRSRQAHCFLRYNIVKPTQKKTRFP
ncbi:hypothetical protein I79_022208 [Cricetulus griseus]|uniref:Uncharacterized protein n=1 Tax=Cricetulus griseus TaxID=10029 RepID=G3IEQ6_CRIGR|nr:hypothetical protein I79_022208 [Cricetulus griseus]